MLLLTESTLWFINLLVTDYDSSNRKKSLSGTVKGWATNVPLPSLRGSANTTPTPSVSGTTPSLSQDTRVATSTTTTSTQFSVKTDTGITTKFGGFDLGDDSEEEAAPVKHEKGKSNDIAVVCIRYEIQTKILTKLTVLGHSL